MSNLRAPRDGGQVAEAPAALADQSFGHPYTDPREDCGATKRNRDDHECRCGRRPRHPENAHLCADCRAQWRDWPGPGEAR